MYKINDIKYFKVLTRPIMNKISYLKKLKRKIKGESHLSVY